MPSSWRCLQPLQRHRSSHDQPTSSTRIASETGLAIKAGAEMAFFTGDYFTAAGWTYLNARCSKVMNANLLVRDNHQARAIWCELSPFLPIGFNSLKPRAA